MRGTIGRLMDWRASLRWRPPFVIALLLLLVVIVGLGTAMRWGRVDSDYYATVSQIIATLFIAVVLEAFSSEQLLWQDDADKFLVLALLGLGLFGLFASVRGLLGGGDRLTSGVAAAGLVAVAVLVMLALLRRIQSVLPAPPATLMLIFLAPPVLSLVIY
jgi:hypothetical protein